MSEIKKIETETKFQTTDGRKFTDEKAAKKHQRFVNVKEKYTHAREVYKRELAEQFLTADGEVFSLTGPSFHKFYRIENKDFGKPRLIEFDPWVWHVDFVDSTEYRDDDPQICFVEHNGSLTEWRKYRPTDIYYHRRNAEAAYIEAVKRYISDLQSRLGEMETQFAENKRVDHGIF